MQAGGELVMEVENMELRLCFSSSFPLMRDRNNQPLGNGNKKQNIPKTSRMEAK